MDFATEAVVHLCNPDIRYFHHEAYLSLSGLGTTSSSCAGWENLTYNRNCGSTSCSYRTPHQNEWTRRGTVETETWRSVKRGSHLGSRGFGSTSPNFQPAITDRRAVDSTDSEKQSRRIDAKIRCVGNVRTLFTLNSRLHRQPTKVSPTGTRPRARARLLFQ